MQQLARELQVLLPVSFFERSGGEPENSAGGGGGISGGGGGGGVAHFNSLVVIDADGKDLGVYRKSHIPDGPGYQEKFYFSPGDSGFKVFKTRYAAIGCGIYVCMHVCICWDQWFPEAARVMALKGAELLLYPTAIGSEPHDASIDSQPHWTTVMRGHAAANLMPVIASNRIGTETISTERGPSTITFYGSSFITGPTGEILQQAGRQEEAVLVHSFDLDVLWQQRIGWGIFRDRRPDLYSPLLSLDGSS